VSGAVRYRASPTSGCATLRGVTEELDRWAAEVAAKSVRYQRMQREVADVTVTASSPDGLVTVTVNAAGVLTDLRFTDRAAELAGSRLAALVLATMRRAQARITDRVAEVLRSTVGDDAVAVDAVVSSYRNRFPEPEPVPSSRPRPATGELDTRSIFDE
jgi:DNA-binding protein YbaB